MPHDKNGTLIQPGDRVTIECVVESVYSTEDGGYCNATVKTVEPMYPTEHPTTITLNARQVIKVEN